MLPLVVRAGAGSVRDSLSILDQLLAGSDESGLSYERAVALLGFTDASLLDEIVDAFAAADGAAVFRVVNRVIEGGHEPRRFAADLLDRFRDLIVLAAVPDAAEIGLLDLPPDRAELMAAQAGQVRPGRADPGRRDRQHGPGPDARRHLAPAAARADVRAGAAAGRRHRREIPARPPGTAGVGGPGQVGAGPAGTLRARRTPVKTMMPNGPGCQPRRPASRPSPPGRLPPHRRRRSSQPQPQPSQPQQPRPGQPQPRPSASPGPASPGPARPRQAAARPGAARPAPAQAASPERAAGSPGLSAADSLRQNWDAVLEAVKQERRVAWMLLSNASVLSLEDGILTLRFPRDGDLKGFSVSGHDAVLKRVLSASFGLNVTVKGVAGGDDAAGAPGVRPGSPGPAARPPVPAVSPRPRRRNSPRPDPAGYDDDDRRTTCRPMRCAPDEPSPDDRAVRTAELTGMDLIQRELGGQVIGEIEG